MPNLVEQANALQGKLVEWRRHLHQNPEVSMELPETAAFVKERLEEMGYEPAYVAGTGVVALAGRKKPGKCFLLRADMDALPILEDTDLEYKSVNGRMHACGHDFHTTMLLGAAKLLKEHEDEIEGTVKLMFQPAEETLKGAKAMIDAGILENPRVDAAMMIHVGAGIPNLSTGLIIVPDSGTCTAASDWFEIHINGKGGHGAMPEMTVDPLNVAAHTHIALQEINSREISAADSAVVTVGMMSGGTTSNVIPDTAVLNGTIRTFDEKVRQFVLKRVVEISEGTAKAFRAETKADIIIGCPSAICDQKASDDVRNSLREVFGPAVPDPAMLGMMKMNGSEDFSFVTQLVPSVFVMVSAGSVEEGYQYPMHHPKATFNETALSRGAAVYAVAALGWLSKNK
ncbi:MAG: M20 family metallopeptidase [Eubacteriales bacterium]|nr:M20 family metallopeptidase [Eubacteriales bacterium]